MNVGTRTSTLALWQTNHVCDLLTAVFPTLTCNIIPYSTKGDQQLDQPLWKIGGKGLFTEVLENGLRAGDIDFAVHSLKDLPTENPDGLVLGAIIGRADVRDVLVANNGWTLQSLPHGATVGTSSLRRQAQLLAVRPDLTVKSIRGNVETRIRKVHDGQYDAAVLAAAGITRLGLDDAVTDWLPLDIMLPAPGQGALGIQCRAADADTLAKLNAINTPVERNCVTAERDFLSALQGGCSTPVAAFGEKSANNTYTLTGLVQSLDGTHTIRVTGHSKHPHLLGQTLAKRALAQGADRLLADAAKTKALAGKRIVVTRARHQAPLFADQLSAHGALPITFPAIEIIGSQANFPRPISAYDWLLFTSVHAVGYFLDAHPSFATSDNKPKIGAVGTATKQALNNHGIGIDKLPDNFTGADLVRSLGDITGQRVLLPRAKKGRPEVVELLLAAGAFVDDIALYEVITAEPNETDWATLLAHENDVLTFTSPSSVRNFLRITADSHPTLTDTTIACLGSSTAAEARAHDLPVHIMPDTFTIPNLVEAIANYFSVGAR